MSNVLQRAVEAYERGDLADARRLFEKTLGVAQHNLAVIAARSGDDAEPIRLYREALISDPGRAESAFELSLHLLRQGRYAEAWPLHESRRAIKRLGLVTPNANWPEWTGQDLAGKRLAVLGEQGFGDQIMFARFLPALRAMGAEVRLVCAAELTTLLGGVATASRSEVDYWRHLQSLPLQLGVTLETIPPPTALPVARRGGGGVGVMVAGSPKYARDARRTPPDDIKAELLALGRDLRPEATGARDFLQTAEIVAGLDLVITIDTAMAHLAGSLGIPTWVLLPAPPDTDWRWLRDRADSPWYPSARLFRQPTAGDWMGVMAILKEALR
ncbi:MAG TPA: hypothetical protein VJS38_02455 [Phenylobacterium sp.]|uniref:hypothetical protein n=1 Tax=Phenylobacterium sp. TaxID=1871053 RepID=UPI002B485960|nr:hypothetical protein [Phenylobacterium sp.]HKR87010.1 hypothetical protein [Phenylobacterium sp.]